MQASDKETLDYLYAELEEKSDENLDLQDEIDKLKNEKMEFLETIIKNQDKLFFSLSHFEYMLHYLNYTRGLGDNNKLLNSLKELIKDAIKELSINTEEHKTLINGEPCEKFFEKCV